MERPADEDVVATRAGHRRRELGIDPEQRERHQQRADDDGDEHVAVREVRRRLQEQEDRADRDVHAERVHDQGIDQRHLPDEPGGLTEKDAGRTAFADRDCCTHISPFCLLPLSGADQMKDTVLTMKTLNGEAKAIRPIDHA